MRIFRLLNAIYPLYSISNYFDVCLPLLIKIMSKHRKAHVFSTLQYADA